MNELFKGFYDKSPAFLQNAVLTGYSALLHGERYGEGFARFRELLEKSQWYTPAELAAYQQEQLRLVVTHAYETVPYYRRVFDARRLKPVDIQSSSDLSKIGRASCRERV